MSRKSGVRQVYEAPRAVLVGGFGVSGSGGSGLFTGNDTGTHNGMDSWGQSSDVPECRPLGVSASSSCTTGSGVSTVSIP